MVHCQPIFFMIISQHWLFIARKRRGLTVAEAGVRLRGVDGEPQVIVWDHVPGYARGVWTAVVPYHQCIRGLSERGGGVRLLVRVNVPHDGSCSAGYDAVGGSDGVCVAVVCSSRDGEVGGGCDDICKIPGKGDELGGGELEVGCGGLWRLGDGDAASWGGLGDDEAGGGGCGIVGGGGDLVAGAVGVSVGVGVAIVVGIPAIRAVVGVGGRRSGDGVSRHGRQGEASWSRHGLPETRTDGAGRTHGHSRDA